MSNYYINKFEKHNNHLLCKYSHNQSKFGFSAIEVLMGAVLMASLIAGILQLISQGNYLVELSRDHTRVAQVLQSEIEDMRTLNWSDLTTLPSNDSFSPEGSFISSYKNRYICSRTISSPSSTQRQVLVSATWTDSRSRSHTTNYITRFSKEGLNDYYYRAIN